MNRFYRSFKGRLEAGRGRRLGLLFRHLSSAPGSSLVENLRLESFKGPVITASKRALLDEKLVDFFKRNYDRVEEELGDSLAKASFNLFRRDLLGIDSRVLRRVGRLHLSDVEQMLEDPHTKHDEVFFDGMVRHARIFFKTSFEESVRNKFVADLRLPHQLYPEARTKKRKIIYHHGPTNSGKTYTAMEALKKSKNGVYAGPLRLLALECFERLNRAGVYASLLTGQEIKEVPFATHTSCTVEMMSVTEEYEVVVIDEIQLIGDADRGSSWTRVLLGANAKEIHVCGDGTALELVKQLADICGDEFEDHTYVRRTPLTVKGESLEGKLTNLKRGDALIAFRRQDLFRLKHDIERMTSLKCCVIYGSLPPETRARQAKLFNDPDGAFDVLVATDAIGMGLNLNIGRIIFSTLVKKSRDVGMQKVSAPHVRQIAGRAGRDGTEYANGEATCLEAEDMDYFLQAMAEPPVPLEKAGIVPTFEQMEDFASHYPNSMSLAVLLDKFIAVHRVEKNFRLCSPKMNDFMIIADMMEEHKSLSMKEKFYFLMTPVNFANELLLKNLARMISEYSQRGYVRLYENGRIPDELALFGRTIVTLHRAEGHCALLDAYLFLANTIGSSAFLDYDQAKVIRKQVVDYIDNLLWEARYVPPRQTLTANESRDTNNQTTSVQEQETSFQTISQQ
ncbi:hypothetical protein NDN08_002313 [Rhodosorus marinus]|uniref:RNA helicase n=1 Tax=Rhodosorus marinus TaxID=101924 RepID=A0AAV8UTF8_9RHOD|nr:hypothetical protein NDN08_002313 [Rhodosorus marinus]